MIFDEILYLFILSLLKFINQLLIIGYIYFIANDLVPVDYFSL